LEREPEEENGDDKNQQRYLNTENGRLKAHRFVGTVCFEGTTINIWPRVFRKQLEAQGQDLDKMRGVMTRNMLYWASKAEYLTLHPSSGDSSTPPERVSNFFEAYVWLFADFTRDLLARQPYWQYQSEVEEGEVLRGRLVMNQYINDCLARGRWHRLVHEHEPFDFDNLLNRIIKRACKLAQGFCGSPAVKERLGEILFELDEVEDVFCTARDCDRVHLNRMHTEYQIVLDNCRMILSQCQADNSGRDMRRFCFLLPMDRLFEEYLRVLAGQAIQNLSDGRSSGWHLADKDGSGIHLAGGFQPFASIIEKRCFRLIHDLLFEKTDKEGRKVKAIIADAKWKSRAENEDKYGNYGVSQGDMYQMVAYAHGRGSNEVRLLYPAMVEASGKNPVAILTTKPGGCSGVPIQVHVHELKIHWLPSEPVISEDAEIKGVEDKVLEAFRNILEPEAGNASTVPAS
jgi:5-methylcytosine-specific restriction enzyme subunit McrC